MGVWSDLRRYFEIRDADAVLKDRTVENNAMLRQRVAHLQARFAGIAPPEPGEADSLHLKHDKAVYEEAQTLLRALDKKVAPKSGGGDAEDSDSANWDDAQRCEILLARLASPAVLATTIEQRLKNLENLAPRQHAALAGRWKVIELAGAEGEGKLDVAAARAVLTAAIEEIQWRETRSYYIRKLGIIFAARLISIFFAALVIGFALVCWEVYLHTYPIDESRFSGFFLALVAGLLGATFSALTKQRTVTELTNLEEVRTAIGYPMILLRLGVGIGAAAILYFFFEAGLVEGVLFPRLGEVGFNPVALGRIVSADGEAFPVAIGTVRESVDLASGAARSAAEMLDKVVSQAPALSNADRSAELATHHLGETKAALERAGGGLAGSATVELGQFVPNEQLSKLVVWSFLAGFFEKLVPSILGRVKNTATNEDPR
jgi:hypothetical protein